jgi:amino acid transporter
MQQVELAAVSNVGEQPALALGALPLWKAVGLGLAAMQVGPAYALAAGLVVSVAGQGAWISMAIAIAIMFCVAAPIAVFARRFVVTGSLMSYIAHVLPPGAAQVTGASLFVGYLLATAAFVSGSVIFASSALLDLGVSAGASLGSQSLAALLVTLFSAGCAYRGIDTSVRVATILGFACVPPLLLISVALAWHHPVSVPQMVSLHGVSMIGVSRGVWLCLGSFIGFDGLTSLAAETRDPLRNTPRILLWSLGGAAAFALAACLFQTPYLLDQSEALAKGASPVAILADLAGVAWIKTPIDVLMICASVASTVGYMNFGSRVIATTAADGLLPAWLAVIHKHYHSPHRAVVFLGVVGFAAPVVFQLFAGLSPLTAATYLTNMASYNWAPPYMLICVAIIALQRRDGQFHFALTGASVVAFAAFGYIAFSSLLAPASRVDAITAYGAFGAIALVSLYFYWVARRGTVR